MTFRVYEIEDFFSSFFVMEERSLAARSEKDRAKSGIERLTEYYASGITMNRTPVWAVLF